MKSPGTMLREAREDRGLSLNEAAALTRVPRTTLLHIEQDRFDEFKAAVFVRGHLRNYARDLGCDAERVVKAYEKMIGTYEPSSQTVEMLRAKSDERSSARPNRGEWIENIQKHIRPTHMLAVALVLTAVAIFASLLSGSRATAKDPVEFPTSSQHEWELENDVQETRWLLEQTPDSDTKR